VPNGKVANAVRFDCFEVNLRSGELYRSGQKIALPEQSFRVLELLIGSPGQIVTREEIRERLWPNGTIVEFENAINAAIKKLRNALGDAADQPRYIDTIKRRGYRLIVPVEEISSGSFSRDDSIANRVAELTGKRVSHYRVLDLIGIGGMGVVYRAEDSRLGRHVVLKFLPDELSKNPIALDRLRLRRALPLR
jgi:eukaryotic-like serine/threonine-protein kinase